MLVTSIFSFSCNVFDIVKHGSGTEIGVRLRKYSHYNVDDFNFVLFLECFQKHLLSELIDSEIVW